MTECTGFGSVISSCGSSGTIDTVSIDTVAIDTLHTSLRVNDSVKNTLRDSPIDKPIDSPIDTLRVSAIDTPIDTLRVSAIDTPRDTLRDIPIDTRDNPRDTPRDNPRDSPISKKEKEFPKGLQEFLSLQGIDFKEYKVELEWRFLRLNTKFLLQGKGFSIRVFS
jgi:hypothetical protein